MMLSRILGAKMPQTPEGGAPEARSASRTHVGHVRQINEDRILDRPERRLWAVADGMGGHHSGDVAAQLVIDALDAVDRPDATAIIDALQGANRALYDRARKGEPRSGTTIVVASVRDGVADIFWAGDSRAYLVRAAALELLTRDHSLVQRLVDAGALSAEEAVRHPKANVITRALGVEAEIDIEYRQVELRQGDMLLLCSDGLSRTLGAEVPRSTCLEDLASLLIDQAMRRDGTDNASLIVAAIA
jgi:serine/threonine protein phosphatase Stp1